MQYILQVTAVVDKRCEGVGIENSTYGIEHSTMLGRSLLVVGHLGYWIW